MQMAVCHGKEVPRFLRPQVNHRKCSHLVLGGWLMVGANFYGRKLCTDNWMIYNKEWCTHMAVCHGEEVPCFLRPQLNHCECSHLVLGGWLVVGANFSGRKLCTDNWIINDIQKKLVYAYGCLPRQRNSTLSMTASEALRLQPSRFGRVVCGWCQLLWQKVMHAKLNDIQ